ncbi:hypothetical protein V6N12_068715 [Hibiscus sabdariffa]|uniref:Uncharacterized protein n=1 Tax=Hibiscus sabdariffa TaxID=183260 RepID=A0ABR2FQT2_9ROSI
MIAVFLGYLTANMDASRSNGPNGMDASGGDGPEGANFGWDDVFNEEAGDEANGDEVDGNEADGNEANTVDSADENEVNNHGNLPQLIPAPFVPPSYQPMHCPSPTSFAPPSSQTSSAPSSCQIPLCSTYSSNGVHANTIYPTIV